MSTEAPALSEKQLALETLRQMPESVTLEQISEEMAILAAIRRGEAAADAGRVLSHEEVKRRSAELRSGAVKPVPWAEVKRQARERAGG